MDYNNIVTSRDDVTWTTIMNHEDDLWNIQVNTKLPTFVIYAVLILITYFMLYSLYLNYTYHGYPASSLVSYWSLKINHLPNKTPNYKLTPTRDTQVV